MRWSFATIVLVPRGQPFAPPSATQRRGIFAWAREIGFTGIELADEWLDIHTLGARALREIHTEIVDAGLRVSGLNIPRCLFTREPHAAPEFARVERALAVAGSFTADVVNISLSVPVPAERDSARFPMYGREASPEEHERAAERVTHLGELAKACGTTIAVELHDDGLLDAPDLCLRLIKRVNAANVGLNPDVANLCRGPRALPDWRHAFTLLAPFACNWHVKNYRRFLPASIQNGDIDYAVASKIMHAAGYDGWVSIETRFGDVLAEQRSALSFFMAPESNQISKSG